MTRLPLPPLDIMYRAVEERDESFEGIFFIAVKTTGVFCRPGCRAKMPRRRNMEFFATSSQALARGYRPCKLCLPLQPAGSHPDWLAPLMAEIENDPHISLKDADLRRRGLDPARLRRWFKRHHGLTFQAWLRARRVGEAHERLAEGIEGCMDERPDVTQAAFASGYQSLSGFASAFRDVAGFSPSKSRKYRLIRVRRVLTPLGPMLAGASDRGICLFEFAIRQRLARQLGRLQQSMNANFVPGNHVLLDELQDQLQDYFARRRENFDLPLDVPGTSFQQRVWQGLRDIPYGQTRSYQAQAEAIGKPQAVRAVAAANGRNRIAIIIPCHRVIGKNGKLTGFGGELWRKQYLLSLEQGLAI